MRRAAFLAAAHLARSFKQITPVSKSVIQAHETIPRATLEAKHFISPFFRGFSAEPAAAAAPTSEKIGKITQVYFYFFKKYLKLINFR